MTSAIRHLSAAVAALALAAIGCRDHAPELGVATANACDVCTDPETEAGSYVSIGVMPAPYPVSWANPYDMFVSLLSTTAVSNGLQTPHSIGHVLLKVRCGTDNPTYISQTGANDSALSQFYDVYHQGPRFLFGTHEGMLYPDDEAEQDWKRAIQLQNLLPNRTRMMTPRRAGLDEVERIALERTPSVSGMLDTMDALPGLRRHRFVRATVRISEDQCRAILAWKTAYARTGGSERYGVHRAPWIRDTRGDYDGGGCGSVSFAGAFYAAGLDYKRIAKRLVERLEIGTGRLTGTTTRPATPPSGGFLLQNENRYVPGNIPCATGRAGVCWSWNVAWADPMWRSWAGGLRPDRTPIDQELVFSRSWKGAKQVGATTVPLIVFEPERFYGEIRARLDNANHDAFSYTNWCKLDTNGRVPTIVLDAIRPEKEGEAKAGRPQGLINGFGHNDTVLPK